MIVYILNGYDDYNDMCKPRRLIYKWEKYNMKPFDLYNLLKNVKGNLFIKL